ncbi:sugar phosphate isomerase/epimerase [Oceanobacillus sp. CFH 90083]|uniref:sugar phosphate isomerase/epimerase family protein n=1 Tax=Oceanobacillus sp. CFH 90083 TaxID=2592336 RepID=UPI0018845032|nr:sugar phosphate isomerase/epimerase [Oceanobacillus sp. CFH 90083]
MGELKIALQLYSVKDALAQDLEGTLKEVSEIGYRYVEYPVRNQGKAGEFIPEVSADTLKKYLDKYDLKAIGTHTGYENDLNIQQVGEYNLAIGSQKVIIPAYFFTEEDSIETFSAWLNEAGKQLKEMGIGLYYHNHYHEFQKISGEVVLEGLVERTDSKYVNFELDTFWALRAGYDPLELMDRLGNRIHLIHQKDLNKQVKEVNLLQKVEGKLSADKVFGVVEATDFVEIGDGIMEVQSIVEKAKTSDVIEYIVVEQDRTTKGELESAQLSFQRLNEII